MILFFYSQVVHPWIWSIGGPELPIWFYTYSLIFYVYSTYMYVPVHLDFHDFSWKVQNCVYLLIEIELTHIKSGSVVVGTYLTWCWQKKSKKKFDPTLIINPPCIVNWILNNYLTKQFGNNLTWICWWNH